MFPLFNSVHNLSAWEFCCLPWVTIWQNDSKNVSCKPWEEASCRIVLIFAFLSSFSLSSIQDCSFLFLNIHTAFQNILMGPTIGKYEKLFFIFSQNFSSLQNDLIQTRMTINTWNSHGRNTQKSVRNAQLGWPWLQRVTKVIKSVPWSAVGITDLKNRNFKIQTLVTEDVMT